MSIAPIIPHILDGELLKERPDSAPFRIDDDGAADWALSRLADSRREQRVLQDFAQTEIERITKWCVNEMHSLQTKGAFFENLLKDYGQRQRRDSDRKTVSTPHGKISSRYSQPKFDIDDSVFIPWALTNAPQLIRTKQEASVSAMREHLVIDGTKLIEPATGSIVEGAVATEPELSITIKTTEEEQ